MRKYETCSHIGTGRQGRSHEHIEAAEQAYRPARCLRDDSCSRPDAPVESFFAGGRAGESSEELRVLVPSVAGGGYDLTARTMVQALADEGTVDADVVVLPGSGGIVGLNRLALESGNPDLLMVMGLEFSVRSRYCRPSTHLPT
ncbi:hypothetical protein ACETU7_31605 [Rhodococcus sp. 3Y1]